MSVPFVFLTASVAGIPELGGTLYGAMVLVGVICALITPRLPPLSRMPDEYYAPVGKQLHEQVAEGVGTWAWARHEGLRRAAQGPASLAMLRSGFATTFDLFFAMMPVAMTIEFIALVIYYHTDLLHILTIPLVPVLELMAIPEAGAAAPGLVIGFLDQFVPALIAGGITSPVTSFVLAGLSVTQLIFMAETGVLIHRSKIPLPIRSLAAIFVIRTVIALPILVAIAHWRAAYRHTDLGALDEQLADIPAFLLRRQFWIPIPEQSNDSFPVRVEADDFFEARIAGDVPCCPFRADAGLPQVEHEILHSRAACGVILSLPAIVLGSLTGNHQPARFLRPVPGLECACFRVFLRRDDVTHEVDAAADRLRAEQVEAPGFCNIVVGRPGRCFNGVAHQVARHRFLQKQIDRAPPTNQLGKLPHCPGFGAGRCLFRHGLSMIIAIP